MVHLDKPRPQVCIEHDVIAAGGRASKGSGNVLVDGV